MSERRQLSEQSRRFNAMIADAVMRARAYGFKVLPYDRYGHMSPLRALAMYLGVECASYPRGSLCGIPGDWVDDFESGFANEWPIGGDTEAYYLGRLYRARALKMHGGGE